VRNRLLYTPDAVRAMFNQMRGELAVLNFKHACEMADLRRELEAFKAELDELRKLRDIVVRRREAEATLADLKREREMSRLGGRLSAIPRCRCTERKPRRRAA
jgi:hypothetical protein